MCTYVCVQCVCMYVCMYGEFVSLDAHLGNGTGRRTATMMAPLPPLPPLLLLLTSGLVRDEAVLHSCGTNPVGGRVATCDSVHSW